jgi:hypothetical protein
MTEAQPIIDALIAHFPWIVKLATAMGFARLVVKPGALWLKSAITWLYERTITTSDTIDDHWLEKMVELPLYRWIAWLLDFLCSVKLPLAEDLFKPTTTP